MKTTRILLAIVLVAISFISQAQHYRKDGMPDMRFSENKSAYSSSYSMPMTSSLPSNNSFPSAMSLSEVRYQSGYSRNDGTIVQSHFKTESNNTNWDNFSTKGNTNSFTGEAGSRARDYSTGALNYGSGQTINVGPKGGQYYINSNGNKTYVPKQPFSF